MDRVIGIDVSKLRLDVYRLADGRRLAVGNDAGGIAALADQLGLGPPAVTSDRPLSARQEVSDENGRRGQPFSPQADVPGRESCLLLALELVDKAAVGASGDGLFGNRLEFPKLMQPEAKSGS
jgi:hypothetical protein